MTARMAYASLRTRAGEHTPCSRCPVRCMTMFKNVPDNCVNDAQAFRHNQMIAKAGTDVYFAEQHPDNMYTVFSGWVSLYSQLENGKRQIYRFALPGDLIGLRTNTYQPISHSATALTDSVLCVYPQPVMEQLFTEHPEVASRMVKMNIRDMTLCQHHLVGTGCKTAEERIAFMLLELFHRVRHRNNGGYDSQTNSICFPLTQQDIGDATGLTAVHVNRVLRKLVSDGAIHCKHRRLSVKNESLLVEISGFNVAMILDA